MAAELSIKFTSLGGPATVNSSLDGYTIVNIFDLDSLSAGYGMLDESTQAYVGTETVYIIEWEEFSINVWTIILHVVRGDEEVHHIFLFDDQNNRNDARALLNALPKDLSYDVYSSFQQVELANRRPIGKQKIYLAENDVVILPLDGDYDPFSLREHFGLEGVGGFSTGPYMFDN